MSCIAFVIPPIGLSTLQTLNLSLLFPQSFLARQKLQEAFNPRNVPINYWTLTYWTVILAVILG